MTLENTIGAIICLSTFSILIGENHFYKFAEHLAVGLAAAHSMVRTFDNYLKPTVSDQIIGKGQWWLLLFLVLGALMYMRHSRKYGWIARYPMSCFVGYGVGYGLAFSPKPFLKQVVDTFIPLNSVNNVIYFVVTIITVSYFLFTIRSIQTSKFGKGLNTSARWVMMVGFGAAFGNIVAGRLSALLGRVHFLLHDWLRLIA